MLCVLLQPRPAASGQAQRDGLAQNSPLHAVSTQCTPNTITLRLCIDVNFTALTACNVCESAVKEKHWVSLIHDLFWGCGQAVKVLKEINHTAAFLPLLQKQQAHFRGDRKCLGAWLPVCGVCSGQIVEEGGVWSSVIEWRKCGLEWEVRTLASDVYAAFQLPWCCWAFHVFQWSAFWHCTVMNRINNSKWR